MMPGEKRVGQARPQDVDRYVGARMRQRRIMLGLTQQQMAELIGVTYQQAHKYEKGINRVAAGRLYGIARALGVEVGYFYEGLQIGGGFAPSLMSADAPGTRPQFPQHSGPKHQEAVVSLARALAESAGDAQAA
jgi:transcriptional regulator with XRE-family HTH domain